ncbi:hypothetical protein L596_017646 [Steinernema carpocapsae]|uniref:Uncharacterized protein n=1 Tax=Steinernema carpocapsae TaxID=34508 RepID=A0A4U5N333_STECR|nr:hypothetical protein L596_017646 [Steinernema carpocapsae]
MTSDNKFHKETVFEEKISLRRLLVPVTGRIRYIDRKREGRVEEERMFPIKCFNYLKTVSMLKWFAVDKWNNH